jgi:propionyl-CoA carboxylase alpha chain
MTITSVLVANRGEIARRIFRTCRLLGLQTVAVYSDADARAPFVSEADVAVGLGGLSAADSYLRVDAIIQAARQAGADAIHPGYGFLSENAEAAQAVVDAGLVWIGPTPANIRAMGTKVEAKALAAAAGVPTLPSATVGGDRPAWETAGATVGYPLLVKASAGGGGKGMRAVHAAAELGEAIEGAQREAAASFGDGTVFLERLLVGPRHIEIQIFGDTRGNVVHLFERECSIQRRHQKIVEEAPSPAVSESLRAQMGAASVALAQAIGYVGAGTVEYLLDADGSFYFLEMNTRLQVEHPVTECITRTDLVAWQIAVANGQPLPLAQEQITREGHAIEVRLYAEDPAKAYMPSVGTLHRIVPAGTHGVRWDSGVESGSVVSPHYDPMLAKVISHAPTREQAAAVLRRELLGTSVHGVTTNAASLAAILGDPAYVAGDTTTAFLDRFPHVMSPRIDGVVADAHLVAMIAARAAGHRAADHRWGFAPSGWRNLCTQGQQLVLSDGDDRSTVSYRIDGDCVTVTVGERTLTANVVRSGEHRWLVTPHGQGGVAVTVQSVSDAQGEQWWANSAQGQSAFVVPPRFTVPSALAAGSGTTAPVPGRIVAVQVAPGDGVIEGQVLVVLEAMKMEHSIRAASASTVAEVRVQVGDQVDARQVLVVLE